MIRVLVAGGFDPIHSGHIDHLAKARSLGDDLTVILQTDENLLKKKGWCLLPYNDRRDVVSSIRYVDTVFMNLDRDGTCANTIQYLADMLLRPDIFAKGGDRTPENMPQNEIEICKRLGIEIVYGCGDLLNSSSNLVEKVLSSHKI
jgi:cytidyltransferase-like protein